MKLKPIYKNILITTGKILFLLFAFISLGFVNHEYKKKKIQNINIKIISDNKPFNCTVEDIEQYLKNNNIQIINNYYYQINFYQLENILNQKNEVKKSSVYFTPDLQLYIKIQERKPIARIYTRYINCYIDDEWKLFKVTKPYVVPLITGNIYEKPELFKNFSINKIHISQNLSEVSVLDDIFQVMNALLKDSMMINYTDYIYIQPNKELILYPIIGKFQILMGNAENFEGKLNKLKLFILNGLNKNDGWNKYKLINLKYKNLIYCTKK